MTLQYTAMVSWTIQGKKKLLHREKTIRDIQANSLVDASKKALKTVKNVNAVVNCVWSDHPQPKASK